MRKKAQNAYAFPIYLPIGAEDKYEGVIDIVNQKAISWGPDEVVNEELKYDITEVPEHLKEKARAALAEIDRCGIEQGRRDCRVGAGGEADYGPGAQGGDPPADVQN